MEMSGLGFPYWIAVRRRFVPHDPFFVAGNIERELLAKQVALDLTEDERYQIHNIEDADIYSVYCPIASCGARLNCLEEFEDHYHSRHMSACAICSRVYPTSRLLSIHVSESHDSFFAAKVARGFPMYECLVEGCGAKLKSYEARKQHLIDKHKFPPSFEFKRAKLSKQRRRQTNQHQQQQQYQQQHRHRRQQDARMEEDEDPSFTLQQKKKNLKDEDEAHCAIMEVEELDELVSSVSRLSASDSTPSSASFGRRHGRAFAFLPRSLRRDPKHQSNAME